MIEVSDVEIKDQSGINSRAQTSAKGVGGDYTSISNLKMPPPLQGRYQSNRPKPSSIVASARQELENLQKSTLPRSRMSVEGRIVNRAGTQMQAQQPGTNARLSIGLPPVRVD